MARGVPLLPIYLMAIACLLRLSFSLPYGKGLPSSTSDISHSRKKPTKLPSSAIEHIKSVVEALAVGMETDLRILIPNILELFGETYLPVDGSLHHSHNNSDVSTLSGVDHSHYVKSTQSSELLSTPTNALGSGQGEPAEGFASQGIGSVAPLLARWITFTCLKTMKNLNIA